MSMEMLIAKAICMIELAGMRVDGIEDYSEVECGIQIGYTYTKTGHSFQCEIQDAIPSRFKENIEMANGCNKEVK